MSESQSNKTAKSIGRAVGVSNYSREDINTLLDLVDSIRPIGKNGWNNLTNKYNKLVNQNRQPDCLRRKFQSLLGNRTTSKQEIILSDVVDRARRLHKDLLSSTDASIDLNDDNHNDLHRYNNDNHIGLLNFESNNTDSEDTINNSITDQLNKQKAVNDGKLSNYNLLLSDIENSQLDIIAKQSNDINISNNSNNNSNEYISYYPSNQSTNLDNIYSILSAHSESLVNLTTMLNSYISQNHQQHTELIANLSNQHHLIQSQLSHHIDIQRQQLNSISIVMSSILQVLSPNSNNNNQNMVYQQPQVYNQNQSLDNNIKPLMIFLNDNNSYNSSNLSNPLNSNSNGSSQSLYPTNDEIITTNSNKRKSPDNNSD